MVISRKRAKNPQLDLDVKVIDSLTSTLVKAGEMTTYGAFGPELLDEVIKEPTLNIYLDRSPKLKEPINYPEMVGVLQHKRAAFIAAEQKRKEPKTEGED